ncbi:polysaccharide deacetylase [Clostridium aceticum]|uniref:Polysaccharide deacetylase n=1 Tax=Clostridium aceticum TaxID=84022 RepID=A0A0G3WFZ6_9CLOT|nr:polysaccharide deacetylase family protein [Clostridium aceticum]AKL96810.1 polysaccharide deacetylase [Clostridium aceticum]
MRKSVAVILASVVLLACLTLGFVFRPLTLLESLNHRFLRGYHGGAIIDRNSPDIKKLTGLDEIILQTKERDVIETAGFYQQMYIEENRKQEIRKFDLKEREKAKKIPVLMYHHLLPEKEEAFKDNNTVVTVENFEKQMEILHQSGYHTITLYELEGFLSGNLDLPKKTVAITFDDGYLSNIEYAYPILKEYGFKASIFAITHEIAEESEAFDPTILQYIGWRDMVNTLDVFTYDNHTHDLHRLEEEKGYLVTKSIEEVVEDLMINIELTKSSYFAYPYGHYNSDTLQILEALGIRMAFTVNSGSVRPGDDLLQLNRYGVFRNTSTWRFKRMIGLW